MILFYLKFRGGLKDTVSAGLAFLVMLLFQTIDVTAQNTTDGVDYLVVMEKDSTEVLFPIAESPAITIVGTDMNVNCGSRLYSVPVSQVENFRLVGNSITSLHGVTVSAIDIARQGNAIIIKGMPAGEVVIVYNVGGQIVQQYRSSGETLVIDLAQMTSGVYMLSTKNANYKIKI